MPDALGYGLALSSCVAGLGWLALAMEVHWHEVRGAQALARSKAMLLRVLGSVSLAMSLAVCFWVDHASMAPLVWVMALAGAALLIAFTLSWRPHWLAVLLLRLPVR